MRRCRTPQAHSGFTLVELLVVIGIIAILISILMPALTKVRNQALAISCANNMRQLYQTALMFSTDHKGALPSCGVPTEDNTNPEVQNNRWWASPGWGRADVTVGVLHQFVPGQTAAEELIKCPGDNGEASQVGTKISGDDRNMSYSFNAQTNDITDHVRGGAQFAPPGIRINTVARPAERIYIFEEIAPNDSWCLMYDISQNGDIANFNNVIGANGTPPAIWRGDDLPSGRHAGQKFLNGIRDQNVGSPEWWKWAKIGKGNFVFFDGHVQVLSPADLYHHPDYFGPLRNPTPWPDNPG